MASNVASCPRDGTFFDEVEEGWRCAGCGEVVCPLCVNPMTELCYRCEDEAQWGPQREEDEE